jgi:hypothetical protein
MGDNNLVVRLLQERGNFVETFGEGRLRPIWSRLDGILIRSGVVTRGFDVSVELGVLDPGAPGDVVVSVFVRPVEGRSAGPALVPEGR